MPSSSEIGNGIVVLTLSLPKGKNLCIRIANKIQRCFALLRTTRYLGVGETKMKTGLGSLTLAAFIMFLLSPAGAQQPQPKSASPPHTSSVQTQPAQPVSPAAQHPPQLRFVVVLDPAHGGTDNGAMLAPSSPEKNYTLALANRLRALLNASGIPSISTRDADTTVDDTARAVAANGAQAAACILLHATSTGDGVHLFTSSIPPAGKKISQNPRRTFLPWQTAQTSYGTASLRLESDLNAALTDQHVPALLDRTSLVPLDSMACPAVAVEIAPLDANTPLADQAYQQRIAQALASALTTWRSDWRLQP